MKLPILLVVALAAGASLPAGSATARQGWTNNGPDGGGAALLEIDPRSPSTVYVSTAGAGVFRSTDGGRT